MKDDMWIDVVLLVGLQVSVAVMLETEYHCTLDKFEMGFEVPASLRSAELGLHEM